MNVLDFGIRAAEMGLVPDALLCVAIRRLCRRRLIEAGDGDEAARRGFLQSLHSGPIALVPEAANRQHYELPPAFFAAVLGSRRKYSCCYFPHAGATLDQAEEAALEVTCQRAELVDGQSVLELGCGWGSLTLWMAERFPNSRITAVSNSARQRESIQSKAATLGLENVEVITADINDFSPANQNFDRIVSVEMLEHMRNYDLLLKRLASWLGPGGKLFVHIFCHRTLCYPFETSGAANWMGRHFFTGGLMPSADLLERFDCGLRMSRVWTWLGTHYCQTAAAWLTNLDRRRELVLPILAATYGQHEASRWFHRWRVFFLAVAELFGFAGGEEWFVSHYLMQRA
jgi:cyclopropane-fatty-acyl-phospholipid synthase